MLVFIKKFPEKQIELKSYEQNAESSWSHSSFCSPCYHKAATAFLFLSSLVYQGNRNKQLASLADSCINRWFWLFYKMPHLQHIVKETYSSYVMSRPKPRYLDG